MKFENQNGTLLGNCYFVTYTSLHILSATLADDAFEFFLRSYKPVASSLIHLRTITPLKN